MEDIIKNNIEMVLVTIPIYATSKHRIFVREE